MIDHELKSQLAEVFQRLDNTVYLQVFPLKDVSSDSEETKNRKRENYSTILEYIEVLKDSSSYIKVIEAQEVQEVPTLGISKDGNRSQILFRGAPGGHEFSSLVLAVLNANGKGRLPDEAIQQQVKALPGPVRVETYISLTCENCPHVVQSLNQMALFHEDFVSEVRDGSFYSSDIDKMGIQGVPSVIIDEKLVSSGKAEFMQLLSAIKQQRSASVTVQDGSSKQASSDSIQSFDVVVIGGGPAGVSAAIYTARKGLKTAIVTEVLGGQLRETKGIENLISAKYTEGMLLTGKLIEHLEAYPIKILEHRRVEAISAVNDSGSEKKMTLNTGEVLKASSVIVATGAKWRQLGVENEKQYIGSGVAFCAHCDGPFYKGKRVAVVGGGNSGVEAALDLANLASDVVLLEYSGTLKADQVLVEKLKSVRNARIITHAKTTKILGDGKKVTGLEFLDQSTQKTEEILVDGIFVQIGLSPNTGFLKGLAELTTAGEVIVDPKGRTNIPGIYAAGDVTTIPFKQIVIAMGEGAKVALSVFEDRMRAQATELGSSQSAAS